MQPRFVPTRALIGSGSDPASSHGEAVEAAPHIVATRFGVSSLSNLSKATKSTNCKKASGSTGNQGSIPMMGSVSDNDDDDDDDDDSDGDEDDTVSSSDEVALPSGSRVATRRPSAVTQRISYKDDSSTSSEEERDSGPSKSKLTKTLKAVKKTSTTSTVPPRSKTLVGKKGRGRHDDGSDGDSKSDNTSDDPSYDEDWHEVASPSGSRVATRRPSAVTQRISYKDDSSTSSDEERDSGPSKSKLTKASTVAKKTTTSTVPPRDKKTPLGKRGRGRHDDGSDRGSKVARHSLRRDTSAAAEPTVIVLDD
jgi:hypothetical protein